MIKNVFKINFKKYLALYALLLGIIFTKNTKAQEYIMPVLDINGVSVKEIKMNYDYGDEGVVIDSEKNYSLEAEAGKNYEITVSFTGTSENTTYVNIGYDYVTEDQIVPNINASANDRSGLINESVKKGVVEKRIFNVAAIDNKINLHFSGEGQLLNINLKEIKADDTEHKTTIYTIGDSLVQTYSEKYLPQTGWGQTLGRYFNENVICENYAIGGRSTGNFLRQGRLNEVLTKIRPGDYVFIEFGHNDASSGNEDRYVSVDDYKKNLSDIYIKAVEQRGGIAVLVTLANRNDYNKSTGVFNVSFPQYVSAMKEVANETGTKIIDLNAMTVEYFTKLNKELGVGVTDNLIYNHAMAGMFTGEYVGGVEDNTHLGQYGAMLVGGMVARGAYELKLPGLLENYVDAGKADKVPETPENITKKKYSGFISRIKWDASDGADYYKVSVADVADGKVSGDFKVIGYTPVCDFSYDKAALKHDYAYKITAINSAGESKESEVFIFTYDSADKKNNKDDYKNNLYVRKEEKSKNNLPIFAGGIIAAVVVFLGLLFVFKRKKK